jgi:hypothetical protein
MSDITCTVAIDAQPVASSAASLEDGQTTALDALSITWGRDTRLDQPQATTCTLRLALPADRAPEVMDQIAPGRTLTVTSALTVDTPADVAVLGDLTQASVLVGTVTAATPTRLTLHADTGGYLVVDLAPGPLQDEGTNPAAWDELPRIIPGAAYRLALDLDVPAGSSVAIYPMVYSGPWASAATGPEGPLVQLLDAQPGEITAEFTPEVTQAGMWVGLSIIIGLGGPWALAAGTWAASTLTWGDLLAAALSDLSLTRRDGLLYTATAFEGRITTTPVQWDDHLRRPVMTITATDPSAELANLRLGDQPWPAETAATRLARVVALTGLPLRHSIDHDLRDITMGPRDVDSQPASSLLDEVATTTGGILWPLTHATTGPYLRIEDTASRLALYGLVIPDEGPVTIAPAAHGAITVPARVLDRDGTTISRDTTDLATVVAVTWTETTTGTDGKTTTTDHTETATDPDRLAAYGYRSVSTSTALTTQAAARALAARLLSLTAPGSWTIPEAHWDTDRPGTDPLAVLASVDSTRRAGLPLMLTGVAPWIPGAPDIPVYLDGGHLQYAGGRWVIDLTLTRAATTARALTWADTPPALTWARMTRLTWADLAHATL